MKVSTIGNSAVIQLFALGFGKPSFRLLSIPFRLLARFILSFLIFQAQS